MPYRHLLGQLKTIPLLLVWDNTIPVRMCTWLSETYHRQSAFQLRKQQKPFVSQACPDPLGSSQHSAKPPSWIWVGNPWDTEYIRMEEREKGRGNGNFCFSPLPATVITSYYYCHLADTVVCSLLYLLLNDCKASTNFTNEYVSTKMVHGLLLATFNDIAAGHIRAIELNTVTRY